MYEILVIEDDHDLCSLLKIYLKKSGYQGTFINGSHEFERIDNLKKFDLVLLDIMLPGPGIQQQTIGIDICRKIREESNVPILFMSCIDDEEYVVKGLEIGADDYIVKPIQYKQLMARIYSHIRRNKQYQIPVKKTLTIKNITIDYQTNQVSRNNENLNLSPLEFDILAYLVQCKNRLVEYDEIYKNVWNSNSFGDIRTVMVHVSNLKKKIETDEKFFKTMRNKGYIFMV